MSGWIEYTNRKCWTVNWSIPSELKEERVVVWQLLIEIKSLFESFFIAVTDKHNLVLIYGDRLSLNFGYKAEVLLKNGVKSTELKEFLSSWGLYDCIVRSKFPRIEAENEWFGSAERRLYFPKLSPVKFPFLVIKSKLKAFDIYNSLMGTNYPDPEIFIKSYSSKKRLYFDFSNGDIQNELKAIEDRIFKRGKQE